MNGNHGKAAMLAGLALVWLAQTGARVGDAVADKSDRAWEHYDRGEYPQALRLYRDAQVERPGSAELHFNVGDALFKTGDYEAALQEFEQVLGSRDQALRARTLYNMGNVHFQRQQFAQAVEAYTQALELDAGDQDAKVNLELALEKLQEQQQEQQAQGQEQQDQDPSEKESQPDQGQEQEQQDQEQPQPEQGQEPQPPPSEQKQEEQEQMAISPEEAQQLLEALQDREKEAQKRRFRATGQARGKDW
jgi:Ca-activated chloride channel family protein